MALPDLTGQNIQDTYKRVLTVGVDGLMYDGTGSLFTPLSASHEITKEVTSSYAETASAAYNFNIGNKATIGGNIEIAHGSFLKTGGSNQILFQSTQTYFQDDIKIDNNNSIIFGSDVNYKMYTNSSDQFVISSGSVATQHPIFLYYPDSKNHWFNGNMEIQAGGLTVGADHSVGTGHISASGNISGSIASNLTIGGTATAKTGSFYKLKGDTTKATGLDVAGYISATSITSSIISASGNVYAVDYFDNGTNINTLYDLTPAGTYSSSLQTFTNITASGNISASGKLYGTDVVGDVWKISHAGNHLLISSSAAEQVGTFIQGKSTVITPLAVLEDPGADYYSTLHVIGDTTATNITASGNISASGTSTGSFGRIEAAGSILASGRFTGDTITLGDTNISTPSYDFHIRNNASSTVTIESWADSNQIINFLNDQQQSTGEPDFSIGNYFSNGGLQLRSEDKTFLTVGASKGDVIQLSGSVNVIGLNGHITASGNISASGNYIGVSASLDYLTTTGNISASGTITATSFVGAPVVLEHLNIYASSVNGSTDDYRYGSGTGVEAGTWTVGVADPTAPPALGLLNGFIMPFNKMKNIQAKVSARSQTGGIPTMWMYTGSRVDGADAFDLGWAASSSVAPGDANGYYNMEMTCYSSIYPTLQLIQKVFE